MKKNLRELQRLLPQGFTIGFPRVEGTGHGQRHRFRGIHGHPCVLDPEGQAVLDGRGMPIKVASTGNRNTHRHDVRRMREISDEIQRRLDSGEPLWDAQ